MRAAHGLAERHVLEGERHIVVSETDVQNLHRVDVSVSLKDNPERVLDKVSGLVEPPAPAGIPPPRWSLPIVAQEPAS